MASKFYRPGNYYSLEDLFQIARISILKAFRKFDPNRGSLSTLMHHTMFNDLLKFVSREYKHQIDPLRCAKYNGTILNVANHDQEHEEAFEELLPLLDHEEAEIVDLLRKGFKRKEILQKMNLTTSQYKTRTKNIRRKFRVANV